MKFQTAYDPESRVKPPRIFCEVDDEGKPVTKTKLDQAEACDINNIMRQHGRRTVVAHLAQHQPYYGVDLAVDYETAFNLVNQADEIFMTLPAKSRELFGNNPAHWLDAVAGEQDPEKLKELLTGEAPEPAPDPGPGPESPPVAPEASPEAPPATE